MYHLSLDQIANLLIHYKYLILFPIITIEGPIATIITGFLSSLGYFNFLVAFLVIVVADVFGDVLFYTIGRFGREKFIQKWGHYIGINMRKVRRLESHFKNHSGKTLIFGKLSHAIGAYILIAAGIARMPLKDFIKFNFIATLPKSLILLLIGYYSGRSYYKISKYLDYTAVGTIAIALILLTIYLIMKNRTEKLLK